MKQMVLIALGLVLLSSCARQDVTAPNPTAVQGGISRVQSGVTSAEAQRQEIARLNAEARYNAARVDNKDIFIEGYRKWKATHP